MAKIFLLVLAVFVLGTYGKPPMSKYQQFQTNAINGVQACPGADCEAEAKLYIEGEYEAESSLLCQKAVQADWNYNTDLGNPDAEAELARANIAYANFQYKAWNETIRFYNFDEFSDKSLVRQLTFLNITGIPALDETDLARYNQILGEMSKVYGTAKICPFAKQNCDIATEGLNLEPEIEEIISNSRNSAELAYTWKAWRDVSGKPIKEMYKEYVALSNKAARLNGLGDNGDLWLLRYEAEDFPTQVGKVWEEVKELYQQLYGYVRYRLRQQYPNDIKNANDPIPAHLLGNMWSQTWESIYSLVIPFNGSAGFDVTEQLQEVYGTDNDGVYALFEEANKFFTGLGLSDMSMAYGNGTMITRPPDREVVCHASAWDFCDKKDYRIKMCTNVNQEDFITIHHELGHIQYFINYNDKPITFRDGANPGFHEAIGDVLSLSVATPKHMKKLGLVESDELDEKTTINFLMQKALDKISFLPFGYLIDSYRWRLFDGSIADDKIEYEWLKIRNEIQGIVPPVTRTEEDFDAGAKYHVPGNTPYIRYFVSFIIQFQIHKALCISAGQFNESDPNSSPLYNCDIDGSLQAGAIMKQLLAKGFSENWEDVLEGATGSRVMDASAIKQYFIPLTNFFAEQQATVGYPLDWDPNAFEAYYSTSNLMESRDSMDVNPMQATSPPSSSTTTDSDRTDEIDTPMIVTGIVIASGVAVVSVVYIVKTFILKR